MRKTFLSVTGILILGAIVLLVNGISFSLFRSSAIDLTEEGLYSLTPGTTKIVQSLKSPLTLRYYYSRTDGAKYPAIKLFGNRVTDLLKQYERIGKTNIKLEIYDPRPDSEDEEWAQKYGVQPIQTREGDKLYFGLVASTGAGEERVIPAFNLARQEFLEYDITHLISSLSAPAKPKIAVISSIDIQGLPTNPYAPAESNGWFIASQLDEIGSVNYLKSDAKKIDEDVKLLVVIHPKSLSQDLLFAIDQFVLKGGKLLAFVDPFCSVDQPKQDAENAAAQMGAPKNSDLNALFSKWGVELQTGKVVVDPSMATKVNSGQGGPEIQYVAWLSTEKPNLDSEDVVTGSLERLLFPWVGSLKVTAVPNIKATSLVKTSKDTQLIDDSVVKFGGGDPMQLARNFVSSKQEQVLAVRLSGKFPSNFPNGAPSAPAAADPNAAPQTPKETPLKESKDVSNVVLVADVDMLADNFSVAVQDVFGSRLATAFNDNLNFVLNTAENLLGSDDLISIRSRGKFVRSFKVVEQREREAQKGFQEQEMVLQAKLNETNQRLNELMNTVSKDKQGSQQILDKALMNEVQKFRDERQKAQHKLREVRRILREDKERLGEGLFLLNTFFVPLILVLLSVFWAGARAKRLRNARSS